MADKDIKIGITTKADTAGAEAAEAALKKVDAAADGAGSQLAGGTGLAGKAKEVNKALKDTAKVADAATGSSRAMRAGVQNLGYQVADVAVQLEMGTNAARVFAQQGSQILGVLGPWGAVAGAALAIGGALFTASNNSGDAAEAITEDADEMSEGMKALKQFTDDAAEALEMERLGASNEAFAARITAVDELNKHLARQLEIVKQLRDIELQKQDSVAAADIAEIEASDAAPEKKARRVAKIRAEMDERSRQQQLNAIQLEENKAKLEVEAAKTKAAAAAANFEANKSNYDRNEQELQAAEGAFAKAPDEIERLKAELEELQFRDAKIRLAYGSDGGGEEGTAAREEIKGKEFILQADMMLQSPEELAKVLAEAVKYRDSSKEEFKSAEAALKEAQKGVSNATGRAADVERVGGAQRDLINVQGVSAARTSQSQIEAEERTAAQREAREKQIESERNRRKEERDIERDSKGIPGALEKGLKGAGDVPVTRAVNAAADKLKDGNTSEEFAGLGQALEGFVSAAANMSSGQKKQLNDLAKNVNNLAERLRRVEGK